MARAIWHLEFGFGRATWEKNRNRGYFGRAAEQGDAESRRDNVRVRRCPPGQLRHTKFSKRDPAPGKYHGDGIPSPSE